MRGRPCLAHAGGLLDDQAFSGHLVAGGIGERSVKAILNNPGSRWKISLSERFRTRWSCFWCASPWSVGLRSALRFWT